MARYVIKTVICLLSNRMTVESQTNLDAMMRHRQETMETTVVT